jgi:hypothetical protein
MEESRNRQSEIRDFRGTVPQDLPSPEPRCAMPRVSARRYHRGTHHNSEFCYFFHGPFDPENVEVPNPDFPGSRATCPLSINGSDVIEKSPIVISTVMKILPPGNPICRVPISLNSFLYLRVKPLATSPRSNDQWDFTILLYELWPLILLLGESFGSKAPFYSNLLLGPSPRNHEGTIPPDLVNSTPSETSHALSMLDPQQLSKC